MVEATIFADDDNDVLDRRGGLDPFDGLFAVMIAPFLGANALRKDKGRNGNAEQAKPAR